MKDFFKGIFMGLGGGLIGTLCCLGPTVLILVGLAGFFGITGACYHNLRIYFLAAGLIFLGISFFIYSSNKKKGICKPTSKKKIYTILIALVFFLVFYWLALYQLVPYLQLQLPAEFLVCSG